jgi:hypothetical protein
MTGVKDIQERREVALLGIISACLQADNVETIKVLFCGKPDKTMVRIDLAVYWKYVTYSTKRASILYVKLSKALYGRLRVALLFYKRLYRHLESTGLEINP